MSDDIRDDREGSTMGLGIATVYYLVGLGAFAATVAIVNTLNTAWGVVVLVYLGVGFFLNRTVLRNLIEFHPMYNTLENVYQTKLRALLFWPIQYLLLIVKIGITKAI